MRYPTVDDDGDVRNGRCYMHGGHPDSGGKKVEDAADAFAIYTERSEYYKNQPANDQILIDKIIQTFVDKADFDESDLGLMEIVRQAAIDLHSIRHGQDKREEEGITTEYVIDVDEDGNRVWGERENDVNLPIDRLEKSTIKRLKEIGCLPDPDSEQAEATMSLAEVLSGNSGDDDT